jgi:nucleotide-binding universal stress UspA family protein
MSTHGRSGVRRWMLGSVTEKVVRHADDPVLIVRGV